VDWYLIVRSPVGGLEVWPVGDHTDEDLTAVRVAAGTQAAGVQYADGLPAPGWDVSLTPGTPHPEMLAVATVHGTPPVTGGTTASTEPGRS